MKGKNVRLTDFKNSKRVKNIIIAYNSDKVFNVGEWMTKCPSTDCIAIFNLDEELIYSSEKVNGWDICNYGLIGMISFEHIVLEIIDENGIISQAMYTLDGKEIVPMCIKPEFRGYEKVILVTLEDSGTKALYLYDGTCILPFEMGLKRKPIFMENYFIINEDIYSYNDGRRILPKGYEYKKTIKKGIICMETFKTIDNFFGICDDAGNIVIPYEYVTLQTAQTEKGEIIIGHTKKVMRIYIQKICN